MRSFMGWKRRVGGGVLATLGFMLSPLSWWNDLIVNLPLALAFAWIVALVYPPWFKPAVIFGYWLTNVLGLILLQKGVQHAANGPKKLYTRNELLKDLGISLLYTALIVVLVQKGVLKPITDYFQ
jgi:hypothetical protein